MRPRRLHERERSQKCAGENEQQRQGGIQCCSKGSRGASEEKFWYVVAAAVAIPEIFASIPTFNTPSDGDVYIDQFTFTMKSNRVPGDLGFDPLGLKPADENEFLELQNKELNNGRLAMIGIAGMIGQELATGQKLFP